VWENTDEFKYLTSHNILININEKIFKRGINGLDYDDGTFIEIKTTPLMITLIVVAIVSALIIIYFTAIWLCCPPDITLMPPIYIRFSTK